MNTHIPWIQDNKDYYYIGGKPNLGIIMNTHIPWMQDIKDYSYMGV